MPKRSSARAKTRTQVPAAYVVGAMLAAAGLVAQPHAASAQSLDTVLKRLEALENSNAKLQQENTVLRDRVRRIEGAKPALAASPAPIMAAAPAGAGGPAIVGKAAPNRWVDATTVTIYGHADLSLDFFDTGVRDVDPAVTGPALGNARHAAVASNLTYLGVRATHDLTNYGYAGWAALLQYETLVETAATPSERAALGSRDSYLGIQGPYGAVKLGKSDTPYKKSTALFDPWRNTIGDYNSIMGNTGGDARAEFDARLPHAIWYE